MLELKDITKIYKIGKPKDKDYQLTTALDKVNLKFRNSEFVSILGPSGCGKTTLLNIIGGLDKYTQGDLIINGTSTKEYADKDWDNYRNNSVGFVFQSYNLIPHQTVLENVELALTLSGVKPSERKQKAKKALEKVGLADRIHSKPNQLSGGQMQRVAIARALVNDPEIILADEPTGALDTKTSVQVMELLKEVSKERLVIMVTHNPDLAEAYSTRIIKMIDAHIIDDSNPISDAETQKMLEEIESVKQEHQKLVEKAKNKDKKAKEKLKSAKKHKKRMSFFTALALSFKNLLTKKARTILVSFAGSIGIIGIALVLSLSSGFQAYIDRVQKDTLSNYPITISRTSTDFSKILESVIGNQDQTDYDPDKVYSNNALSEMFGMLTSGTTHNDLKSFKAYLDRDDIAKKLQDIATIKYTYNLDMHIFADPDSIKNNANNSVSGIDKNEALLVNPFTMMSSLTSNGAFSSIISDVFEEMLDNQKLLSSQYDLVAGKWASQDVYNENGKPTAEVMIVLDKNNAIADYALMTLGLRDRHDIDKLFQNADADDLSKDFDMSIEDIMNLRYNLVLNPDMYEYDPDAGLYKSLLTNKNNNPVSNAYYSINVADKDYVAQNTAVRLKVAGIIKPNKDATATALTGTVCYTKGLTEYVINALSDYAADTGIEHNMFIDQSKPENANRSVISGKFFSLDAAGMIAEVTANQEKYTLTSEQTEAKDNFTQAVASIMSASQQLCVALKFIPSGSQQEQLAQIIEVYQEYASDLTKLDSFSPQEKATALQAMQTFGTALNDYMSASTNVVNQFSPLLIDGSSLEATLETIGKANLNDPASISFYATDFEAKNKIEKIIDDYNDMVLSSSDYGQTAEERQQHVISYNDYVGLMMKSISVIINAITYVLIAFVSISLVVSSIMIGIITYISVLERTKEIGVLRSVGASKRDIKRVFTAESLIIGFVAGVLGILITLILIIPVNLVIEHFAGLVHVASLPWLGAIILVLISMVLTFIAGLIPARIASKKDSVIALRTE